MKSTGVTRRIDELGRIVIPKEIRKNLNIRNGECLEIYVDDNKIILTKQMVVQGITFLAQNIINTTYDIYKYHMFVTDREKVMITDPTLNELQEIPLSKKYLDMMDSRLKYLSKSKENLFGVEGYYLINPLIVDNDVVGLIVMIKDSIIDEKDNCFLNFISKVIVGKLSIS